MTPLTLRELFTLAVQHHQAGRLPEAEQIYRQILAEQPTHAGAMHFLGVLAHQVGQNDIALDLIHRAIALQPNFPDTYNNLGNTLRAVGHQNEAIAAFNQAIVLKSNFPEAHNNLGLALKDKGQLDDAIVAYRQAIALKPDYAQAHNNLGIALVDKSQVDAAIAAFSQALSLSPDYAEAHYNLGVVLKGQGQVDQAVTAYRQAIAIRPHYAEAHSNLGNIYQDQGLDDLAEKHYRLAIQIDPQLAVAWTNLGVLLEQAGDFQAAEHYYRQAILHAKNDAIAHVKLSALLGRDLSDKDLTAIKNLLADPSNNLATKACLHYAAGYALDARDSYSNAAEHFRVANALCKLQAERKGEGYDVAAHAQFVSRMIQACSLEFFQRVQGMGLPTERPVFVFGLPRSGTTLTEQILAGHSQVFGAGELAFGSIDFLSLAGVSSEPVNVREETAFQKLRNLDPETVQYLGSQHRLQLEKLNPSAARVVDKMPDNYLYLGLLAAIFPQAKFIHCRRDLRDVAISCFTTRFDNIPWANDLEQITTRIEEYRRLMEHWRTTLNGQWLDCDYEQTVANLPDVAHRIVAWCGLDWEPACVEFHRVKRPIRTASSSQVRQPIFNRSVGRWKHYQELLAPVLARLSS